jgi:hypothetical protein
MNAPQELRTLLPNLPKSRIPELDGLRGMAILLVLLYHYVSIPPGQPPSPLLQGLFAIGWSGVDLFVGCPPITQLLQSFLRAPVLSNRALVLLLDWHIFYRRIILVESGNMACYSDLLIISAKLRKD